MQYIHSALHYIRDMVPYMIALLPVILIVRAFRVYSMRKKDISTNVFHESGMVLFMVFLVGLASQTILTDFELTVGTNMFSRVNLIPLKVIRETYYEVFINGNEAYFHVNFWGNIIIFVPIGIFIPLLFHNITLKKAAAIGFLVSLCIEVCQLPINRATDVDDLWLNTLGAVLGYFLYLLMEKCFSQICVKFKVGDENILKNRCLHINHNDRNEL